MRLRFERDGVVILLGDIDKYKLLRELLLGEQCHLDGFELKFDRNGKPYLPGGPFVSLSDSHELSAVALSWRGALGVDLQYADYRSRVVERFFSPAEKSLLKNSGNLRLEFAKIWARKEAYAKCVGSGISRDLLALDSCATDRWTEETVGDYALAAYGSHRED